VQRAVEGDVGEVEPDHRVVAVEGLLEDLVPQPRSDPLVATSSHRRVGHLAPTQALRILEGEPVARRTTITSQQSRSLARGRWQPSGWLSSGTGTRGSMACQTTSRTSGSRPRLIVVASTSR